MVLSLVEVGNEAVEAGNTAITVGLSAIADGNEAIGASCVAAGQEALAAGNAIVGNNISLVCGGQELADRMIAMVADATEATTSFIQAQILQGQKLLLEAAKLQSYLKNKALAAIAKVQSALSEAGAELVSSATSAVTSALGTVSAEIDGLMDNWLPEFPDLPSIDFPDLAQLLPDITIPDFLDFSCSE